MIIGYFYSVPVEEVVLLDYQKALLENMLDSMSDSKGLYHDAICPSEPIRLIKKNYVYYMKDRYYSPLIIYKPTYIHVRRRNNIRSCLRVKYKVDIEEEDYE